jgi:hypothetical protein|tara:strand:- start:288 stop:974 length:687 start_codon:yes stop_codon:yes gene_type:complete
MSIMRLKSLHPITEYSPQWNIPFYHAVWNDSDKINTIREGLLRNEQKFLDGFEWHKDAGTGLGPDSVTTRHGRYNLFDYIDDMPELEEMQTFLRKMYINFIEEDNASIRDCEIVCWFNILRDGEQFEEHYHGSAPDAYLTGHVYLDDYKTESYYKSPYDMANALPVPNNKGGAIIFPSYVTHGTTPVEGDEVRVSIAFDIRLPTTLNNKEMNCRPFMNSEIWESLLDT